VSQHVARAGTQIGGALTALGSSSGVIQIDDSATYTGNINITLAVGQRLTLQAADRSRPAIAGSIVIVSADQAALTLDGLLISAAFRLRVATTAQSRCAAARCPRPAGHPPSIGVRREAVQSYSTTR
jgi:hypothetical protein